MFGAVLCGQLFVGWTNDYVDREQDAEAGRRDKPVAAGRIQSRTVVAAAAVALLGCIALSLAYGVRAATAHLAAVALATGYNLGLKVTPLSFAPYAVAFPLLVAFVTLGGEHPHAPPAWSIVAASLLAVGAHFTQVLPDIEEDRRQGKLGLPQRLGVRGSSVAAPALLAASSAVVTFGLGRSPATPELVAFLASCVVIGGVFAAAIVGRLKLAFRLTIVAAAVVGAGFLLSGRSL